MNAVAGISPYIVPVALAAWAVLKLRSLAWKGRKAGTATLAVTAVLAGLAALVPIGRLSLAGVILSVNPVFSIGSMGLVLTLLVEQITGRLLVSHRNRVAFAAWNVTISAFVYASSLGLVTTDVYRHGYGFSPWFLVPAVATVALVVLRNPLALVFLATIAAYDAGFLASLNFFDYLTDGFLFLVSVGVLVRYAVRRRVFRAQADEMPLSSG